MTIAEGMRIANLQGKELGLLEARVETLRTLQRLDKMLAAVREKIDKAKKESA